MNFHTQNVFKKFFSLNGGACPSGHAQAQSACPPFHEKKLFENILSVKIHFVKKSRNLSWVGAYFSLKWLKFPKNAWNFALVEIWSGSRCDMKIILGVFDNLDIQLISHKRVCHHLLYKISKSFFKLVKKKSHVFLRLLNFKAWENSIHVLWAFSIMQKI